MQNQLHLYILSINFPEKKLKKNPIYKSIEKNKILKNKYNQGSEEEKKKEVKIHTLKIMRQ